MAERRADYVIPSAFDLAVAAAEVRAARESGVARLWADNGAYAHTMLPMSGVALLSRGDHGVDDNDILRVRLAYERVRDEYAAFANALRVLVEELCRANDLAIDAVTARAKDTTSLVDKFTQRHDYTSLDDVTDKCGVRVVTRYREAVDDVLDMLRDEFAVIEVVHHGGATPDSFGYSSDHVLIRIGERRLSFKEWRRYEGLVAEVQVRSILQHAWAAISHSLDYKSGVEVPDSARRRLFRVAALLETGDEIFDGYRNDVIAIRDEYRTGVDAEQWRDLPVDLDSVWAAWSKFPIREAVNAAEEAGFLRVPGVDQADPPVDYREQELPTLVRTAAAAGLTKVGDVADLFARVPSAKSVFDAMVRVCRDQNGDPPYAVASDLPVFLLIAERPDDQYLRNEAQPVSSRFLVAAASAGESARSS
ncbi:MAG TPA: hypothetical protein VNA20_04805 [Frankiaceae bacterium]|nr:hypothetical protein [Frankiaceae bacterium]